MIGPLENGSVRLLLARGQARFTHFFTTKFATAIPRPIGFSQGLPIRSDHNSET